MIQSFKFQQTFLPRKKRLWSRFIRYKYKIIPNYDILLNSIAKRRQIKRIIKKIKNPYIKEIEKDLYINKIIKKRDVLVKYLILRKKKRDIKKFFKKKLYIRANKVFKRKKKLKFNKYKNKKHILKKRYVFKNFKIKKNIYIKKDIYYNLNMNELLISGVYLAGNRKNYWNSNVRGFICGLRNNFYLFDLTKSYYSLRRALFFLKKIKTVDGNIMFIGSSFSNSIHKIGELTDSYYFLNNKWVGGNLTNRKIIKPFIKNLKMQVYNKYTEHSFIQQFKGNYNNFVKRKKNFIKKFNKKVFTTPSAVIIFDSLKDFYALKEVSKLGIPVVAINDVINNPKFSNYNIFGNMSSRLSFNFFFHMFYKFLTFKVLNKQNYIIKASKSFKKLNLYKLKKYVDLKIDQKKFKKRLKFFLICYRFKCIKLLYLIRKIRLCISYVTFFLKNLKKKLNFFSRNKKFIINSYLRIRRIFYLRMFINYKHKKKTLINDLKIAINNYNLKNLNYKKIFKFFKYIKPVFGMQIKNIIKFKRMRKNFYKYRSKSANFYKFYKNQQYNNLKKDSHYRT